VSGRLRKAARTERIKSSTNPCCSTVQSYPTVRLRCPGRALAAGVGV